MWTEEQSGFIFIFVSTLISIQGLTTGQIHGPNSQRVCGARIPTLMKAYCKGLYNNNFDPSSTSIAQLNVPQSIMEKCCRSGCTPSEMIKYCGSGTSIRPGPKNALIETLIRQFPGEITTDKSFRLSRGTQPKNNIKLEKQFIQKKNNSTSIFQNPIEEQNQPNLCRRRNRVKHQGKHRVPSKDQYIPILIGFVNTNDKTVDVGRLPRNVLSPQTPGGSFGNRLHILKNPYKNLYSKYPQHTITSDETTENEKMADFEKHGLGNGLTEVNAEPHNLASSSGGKRVTEGPVPDSFVVANLGNENSFAA